MASAEDEAWESFIGDIRPRLKELVVVERLLDHVHFIGPEQKEHIRQRARAEGDRAAADLLIDAVTRRPHSLGWFRAFVDALASSGCDYAADIMQEKLPKPDVEAENDQCVRLIQILSPGLVGMKTEEVCLHCLSRGLITAEDSEIIKAETTSRGPRSGARELLRSIVRGRPGWFSNFLQILRETEHQSLYELTGGSPDLDKEGENCSSLKDEATGSEAVSKSPAAADGGCDSAELMVFAVTEDPQDEAMDLYAGASSEYEPLPKSLEPSQPDGTLPEAAARGPETTDICLRDYQMEVARPALEAKNIIICLPTGSGKTRVAVYITKEHLDRRRAEGQPGKVVMLVNKVPLVEQHYSAEFLPFLKPKYKVERVSGDCQLKISFTEILKKNDVIICTAQILENHLERSNKEEDEGVKLSDLTLIIIDECHHTQKGEVYNHIMMRYLKQKHKNIKWKKEQREPMPLPQILGLTASPGVGGAKNMKKAVEHILRICANLDASSIMTSSLGDYKKQPNKTTLAVEDRIEDPFGDVIKKIMNAIHAHAKLSTNCDLGSQRYEQWIVETEREENKEELRSLAGNPQYENDSLSKLRCKILHEFSSREEARGIIFTKTRRSAIALSHWIQENSKFADIGVKASYVIGGGDQSVVKPMTPAEQKDVLKNFHNGDVNLLIATTVAEEGLDIPACNFVIRYGLVTNEISMIQAEGRGRAEDSSYTLVDVKNSGVAEKEWVNEYRKKMMNKAIKNIRSLNQADYEKQIIDFQFQAIMEKKVRLVKKKQRDMKSECPSKVKFNCRHCSQHVCNGDDINIIENMHRVNVTEQFRELYIAREDPPLHDRPLDLETKGLIACKICGQGWGVMMVYRGIECPCLHVQNFVVTLNGKKIAKCSKWSELPVRFSAFDYAEQARQLASSSDEDDTN
ncbi:interferon-induced helicase C domain-containing protein 1 isoform X2 [Paralichthys olivaceus]|uniref:interferon-induced helicase C domain-containing protein 1 isoform X2 n=1 Tax=Paralichthys olivaceus TaxID=8255 RepID=UPI003750D1B1